MGIRCSGTKGRALIILKALRASPKSLTVMEITSSNRCTGPGVSDGVV